MFFQDRHAELFLQLFNRKLSSRVAGVFVAGEQRRKERDTYTRSLDRILEASGPTVLFGAICRDLFRRGLVDPLPIRIAAVLRAPGASELDRRAFRQFDQL